MKERIKKYLLKKYAPKIWVMCANLAERFESKNHANNEDLQEKFYYWITESIKTF